ncbi:TRAP transporter small permease [Amphritea sp. 2_MG-2023]|jgi:TRAP-type C4-dicarboxylate transport system permease small subunit|uniref:TRAP transporter small permease n=1 Tax=Amphritea TaxID=515417 RepID=UPI001C06F7E6|nr:MULTISPECIES: TRAP transporter small permease [Amphritea]MBU2966569.1 TRAP transporter small permease [Amphritea atlantica]MDO6417572.1 TRAP transporter small permease [Amphritea sp. 2_MG-2023]MDX2422202.1 TRAP transporter small permease [Amphritea sp.]
MTFSAWLTAHYEEKGPVIWLAFFLELIAAVTLFLLMMLTCADVFGRYFLSNSVDGTTELTEMAIAILVFAEMPVITWRGGHVVVDILDRMMGSSLIKVLGLVAAFLMSTSLYFLAVRIFELAERSLRREEVTEFLQFPIGYVVEYIAIMSWITAALMISYGVYRLLFLSRD